MLNRLPIICGNGIGDSLLVLGRIPIELLGKVGFRFKIYYLGPESNRTILAPFLSSIKYCVYACETPSPREHFIFGKLLSISARLKHVFKPPFVHHDLQESEDPSAKQIKQSRQKHILLHTHLDQNLINHGLTAKLWPLSNWTSLCRLLHQNGWTISILEWNTEMRDEILACCPFVLDGRHDNECSLYASFSQYKCVFSVDSWSKYVAAWYRIPQVVVLPDLRVGYPGFEKISATQFVSWWMYDILMMPSTLVLGLAKSGDTYYYDLPSFGALNVSDAFSAINRVYQSSIRSGLFKRKSSFLDPRLAH